MDCVLFGSDHLLNICRFPIPYKCFNSIQELKNICNKEDCAIIIDVSDVAITHIFDNKSTLLKMEDCNFELIDCEDVSFLINKYSINRTFIDAISGFGNIVFLAPEYCIEYVDYLERINLIKNTAGVVKQYNRARSIHTLLKKIIKNHMEIPPIDSIILKEDRVARTIEYFSEYRDYLMECVDSISKNIFNFDTLYKKYLHLIRNVAYRYIYKPLIDQVWTNHNGRKILIFDSALFTELLNDKYHLENKTQDTSYDEFNYDLNVKEYYLVFPTLSSKYSDIFTQMYECNYVRVYDYGVPIHIYPYVLNGFIGEYVDCFNNHVLSNSPVDVVITGAGNTVLNMSSQSNNLKIHVISASNVFIGKGSVIQGLIQCTFLATINIGENTISIGPSQYTVYDYNILKIGSNCLFAKDILFLAGDAHPIFDIDSGQCINFGISDVFLKNNPNANQIIIENYIWIGARVTVLSKTKISSGSVVGAGSLVKNKFPNNCVIAGNPARIIRKNIVWRREMSKCIDDMHHPINQEYIRHTNSDFNENNSLK